MAVALEADPRSHPPGVRTRSDDEATQCYLTFARSGDSLLLGAGNPAAVRMGTTTVVCGAGLATVVMTDGKCVRYEQAQVNEEQKPGTSVACKLEGETLKIEHEDDVVFTGDARGGQGQVTEIAV